MAFVWLHYLTTVLLIRIAKPNQESRDWCITMVYHPQSPHSCTQTSSFFPIFLGNFLGYGLDQSSLKQISHLHSLHTFMSVGYMEVWNIKQARVFSMHKSLVQSPDHNCSFLCNSLYFGEVKRTENCSKVLSLSFSFWVQRKSSKSKQLLPPSTAGQWERWKDLEKP